MKAKVRKTSDRLSPHFTKEEFRCKCRREACDAAPVSREFLEKLEALRVDWGRPLIPVSGQRCAHWNKAVGGAANSQHVHGKAADFWFAIPEETDRFVLLAEKHGFGGIGRGVHRVHIDDREGKARWRYDAG